MSGTLKVTTLQDGGSATANITLDASGNATVGNNLTVTGTTAMASSFKRNRIINGNMGTWQRGTSGFTTSGNYSSDRWQLYTNGTLTTAAQSTDVPAGFQYSLSIAGTNAPQAWQKIEAANSADLVGQSVTVSFWLKQTSGAGAGAMSIALWYPTVVNNFASITQIGSTQTITSTSSWAQYTLTFASMPSGIANGLALIFTSSATGTPAFLITGVQLEVGTKATPYEMQIYSDQLAQCQRYYRGSTPVVVNPVATPSTIFTNSMRTSPTITGGGTGFTLISQTGDTTTCYQTASANQNLTFSAEF